MSADCTSLALGVRSAGCTRMHGRIPGKAGKYSFGRPTHRRAGSGTTSAGEVDGDRDPRRPLGRRGEDQVVAHFQRLGFRLLECKRHLRFAELDLIVFDGHTLVFVEVKTRRLGGTLNEQTRYPPTLGWPSRRQARGLCNAARTWLSEQGSQRPRATEIRFDVVRVLLDSEERLVSLDHIEAAWEGVR
ncbi:MAG TPA: YraN family protein [Solirubrobacteraceae bacterium]